MSAVETHGRSWKYIQMTYYPSRAANHVKNRSVSAKDGKWKSG